ncbi:SIMPL domain-containing protein [Pasteurellaceae bacterium LIM206]|nr:SIMPL domain-containing protein [Pasteurellaceae bacterium LIM206]
MKLKIILFALCAAVFASPLSAQEITQNVVSFTTEAKKEIEPDVLQVSLFYQAEGNNLAALNKNVTDRLNQAVQLAKRQAVTVKDNSRSVNVRYKDGKQTGWIDRGEIVLESRNFELLSQLVGQLDGVLAIENITTSISSEKMATLEEELTQTALEQFKRKADLIKKNLNMKDYRILTLELQDVSRELPAHYVRSYQYAATESAANEALAETGKETVRAVINARIALLNE